MSEMNPVPRKNTPQNAFFIGAVVLLSFVVFFLFSRVSSLEKDNKDLSGQKVRLEEFVKELESKARDLEAKAEKEKKELQEMLDTVVRENKSLKSELEKTKSTLATAAEEKTYLEDILIHKTKEMEKIRVNLGAITVDPKNPAAAAASAPRTANASPAPDGAARKTPREEGRVLAVNDQHGFVVVDLGKVDGIGNETLFSLNKNGEIIGTLKVLEIRDIMTACTVKNLNPGKKIEVNDLVMIRR